MTIPGHFASMECVRSVDPHTSYDLGGGSGIGCGGVCAAAAKAVNRGHVNATPKLIALVIVLLLNLFTGTRIAQRFRRSRLISQNRQFLNRLGRSEKHLGQMHNILEQHHFEQYMIGYLNCRSHRIFHLQHPEECRSLYWKVRGCRFQRRRGLLHFDSGRDDC